MPRHVICDAHEWTNEVFSVPIDTQVNSQPRERTWKDLRGKKTLLSLTLVCLCEMKKMVQPNWEGICAFALFLGTEKPVHFLSFYLFDNLKLCFY